MLSLRSSKAFYGSRGVLTAGEALRAFSDACELRFYLAYGKTLAKVGLRAAAFFVSVDFPAKYAQASWPSPEHYWTAGRARKLAPGPIGPSAAK